MPAAPPPVPDVAGFTARRAGVLAHPTSLGGGSGIGDLGPATRAFLSRAADAGLRAWQVLPLSPCGPEQSPYAALSSQAGNPLLLSPRLLERDGWLPPGSTGGGGRFDARRVDFPRVARCKRELLPAAWSGFRRRASKRARRELERFVEHRDQRSWLEDWSLFAALRERLQGRPWFEWDAELRDRDPAALAAARRELRESIDVERFAQYLFFRQWSSLRRAARARGIRIVGDLPYYGSHDSVDVWAHRELFHLDAEGRATRVGGVPPDYFSATGQRWGNPTFDWPRLAEEGFAWWIERLASELRRVDTVRLDHFRGFAAYWEIDAAENTALRGRWVPGPGRVLFDAARSRLGRLPLIAEDLGLITADVHELRESLELPGMHVLQFAFGAESAEVPQGIPPRSVVYTGTHDNDTTRGWFAALDEATRRRVLERTGSTTETVVRGMIALAFESAATLAVIPLQDLLELGTEARMNTPGSSRGNWRWRVPRGAFSPQRARRIEHLVRAAGRLREPPSAG